MEVVLASSSPRRLELLHQIGINAKVHPAEFKEIDGTSCDACKVVSFNALGKCLNVKDILGDNIPVIAADTIVVIDEIILGKPRDTFDAHNMLKLLSGRRHQVMTGVAVHYQGKYLCRVCTTEVVFRELTDLEISKYVATKEPMDKAGAYGIQGLGALLVDKIEGCYNNVVGLPLSMLYTMLDELGAKII